MSDQASTRLERNELLVLRELVPLHDQRVVELGCGSARLLRQLLQEHPKTSGMGLEIDPIQHAKNLAHPCERLQFIAAGAEATGLSEAGFDLALMLKSLHHVTLAGMDLALAEVHRILRPGGLLYVSEPVYAGALNEITRLFNDEGPVRVAAQAALDRAVASGRWQQVAELRFDVPVHYADFAEFERRMLDVTYAERSLDAQVLAQVRDLFEVHCAADGARFTRPMFVRLLCKQNQ